LVSGACSVAAADNSVRIANINKASAEIAAIQKQKGADGAFAAIHSCYQRELTNAKSLTSGIEACMTQDIIVSRVSAQFYAKLNPEGRRRAGSPEPSTVLNEMAQRVIGVYRRFGISGEDGRAFNQLVEQNGMETYGRTMFPDQFPAKKN
jgi:hypothetical protein